MTLRHAAMLRYWRLIAVTWAVGAAFPAVVSGQVPSMKEALAPARVEASPARTWDATLEFFTLNRIPIRFIDGLSRFAYSERFTLLLPDSMAGADCGREAFSTIGGTPRTWMVDTHLTIHILSQGDAAALVRVVALFSTRHTVCEPSNGSYERSIQELIRDRATRR